MNNRMTKLLFEIKKNKISYMLIAPYFVLFFVFMVFAVLMAIGLSFSYFNILEKPSFVGWQNYSRLFLSDDVFLIAIKNTVLFVAITGPFGYMLSFGVAWFMNELNPRIRSVATLLFYAPALSGAVTMLIWQVIFAGDSLGIVNGFLIRNGFLLEPVLWLKDEKYMLGILIAVQLWLSLGTSFLSFIAGLQTVDNTLYEAGAIDGVKNRWQELWYITLPVMRPYLKFGAVMQITAAFAVSGISIPLLGFPTTNYAGRTIVTHLIDYGTIRYEMGYATSIATVMFVIMITFNKAVQSYLKKIGS